MRTVSGRVRIHPDDEAQPLVGGELTECPLHVLAQVRQRHVGDFNRHRAGLDLREVENVADEAEQIGACRIDGASEFHLLVVQIALLVGSEKVRKYQQRVQWRSQLVAHVGQEFGLVFRGERKLLSLFLECPARHLDFEVLVLDLLLLVFEELRLLLQFLVCSVKFFLLLREFGLSDLKLGSQQLRLRQQPFGAHRCRYRVQHDADRFHELVEE